MKNFTVTLYAKRKSDGTYDYSLKVWEDRSLPSASSFESGAPVAHQLDIALPVGADTNLMGVEIQTAGDYWLPFNMPMSEEQAANLGWRSESPLTGSLVN